MTKQTFRLAFFLLICLSIPMMATAQVVFIPDHNLRTVIENKLGKAPGTAITVADMAWMTDLDATNRNIRNLTGLEHATNLIRLWLPENNITDISPIVRLTRLIYLNLGGNLISNISPIAGLTNLTELYLRHNYISNISPLAGLTRLLKLELWNNSISDISPLARLTNLTLLDLAENSIFDLSAIAGLTNLTELWLDNNSISDLSPLIANTGLRSGDTVDVDRNPLNNAAINIYIPTLRSRGVTVKLYSIKARPKTVNIPDPNLRNAVEQFLGKARGAIITADEMAWLTRLDATNKDITNLTGLEAATQLTYLDLRYNSISDISPLARLTNLTVLGLGQNNIRDISPLAGLTNLTALGLGQNNITNISPLARLTNLTQLGLDNNSISDISPLVRLTQLEILFLQDNSISDLLPLVANIGLRNGDSVDVMGNPLNALSFNTHMLVLQSRGVTVAFDNIVVPPKTVNIPDPNLRNAIEQFLGKARGATITADEMAWLTGLDATNKNITNLTGLEAATQLTYLDLRYNFISDISPLARLTNLTVLELGQNNITDISPLAGLTNLTALNLWDNFLSDISPLVANTGLGNGDEVNVQGNPLSTLSLNSYIPILQSRRVTVEFDGIVARPVDINGDGVVNTLDLVLVASQFGNEGQNLTADVSGDGVVNIQDLVMVIAIIEGDAAAPSAQSHRTLMAVEVQQWLTDARSLEIQDIIMKRGIMVLEQLLLSLTPTETELLANYPNPFNPETWIPYRLAEDAFVTLTIYDGAGQVVRTIDVGHRTAAAYENRSQAIYWDGKNEIGEQVASGVYFYTLSAGDYSATRKMVILK